MKSARAYTDPAYATLRDLAFDAYYMQHVERYGRSAKSYAAHLARLCCGLEHHGDPQDQARLTKRVSPRLWRGDSQSLTVTGVWLFRCVSPYR
jgi:hypothetical protein